MRRSRTSRLAVATALGIASVTGTAVATVVGAASGVASGVVADPACQGVWTQGTLIGTHSYGPYCVPNPTGAALCTTPTVGLDPQALVTLEACVPD